MNVLSLVRSTILVAGLAMPLLTGVPTAAAADGHNPCNPCAAKHANPCAAKHANPCAAKKANPCAAKHNPCTARR